MSYHNAKTLLDEVDRPFDADRDRWATIAVSGIPHDDSRWPSKCEGCDYRFIETDEWQDFDRQIYIHKESGTLHTLGDHTPGMMWYADWMSHPGPDGHSLVVVCPNGREWMIDGRASNCTMPDDSEHRCWIRHGVPPNITVDKNGKTCAAGGGSIQAGDYHGFLRNGEFT